MTTRTMKIGLAAAVLALAAGGLGWNWWQSHRSAQLASSADIGTEQAFALADCKARLFDGSPAIAIGFT